MNKKIKNRKNKHMIIEIIILVLIFLLVVPLRFNFVLYVNLLENKGADFIKFMNLITISQEKFIIANGEFTSQNNRNKKRTIELKKESKEIIFFDNFMKIFVKKMIFSDLKFFASMGKKDDAFVTACVNSAFVILFDVVKRWLILNKGKFPIDTKVTALYTMDKVRFVLTLASWTNLFDLLFCLIKAKIIANNKVKEFENGK